MIRKADVVGLDVEVDVVDVAVVEVVLVSTNIWRCLKVAFGPVFATTDTSTIITSIASGKASPIASHHVFGPTSDRVDAITKASLLGGTRTMKVAKAFCSCINDKRREALRRTSTKSR